MDFEQLFNGRFLRWFDVEDPALVKITGIKKEELNLPGKSEKVEKPIIEFSVLRGTTGNKTELVLNKTNASLIAEIHGRKVSGWLDKEVVFHKSQTRLRGAPVNCVRIRAAKKAAADG